MKPRSGLAGKRILLTRTRDRASELASLLEAAGAVPILIPTIELVAPETFAPLDAAISNLDAFDWMIFTSVHAVDVFVQRSDSKGYSGRIAAIGPATARAIEQAGLVVDLIPPRYIAESLAESLATVAQGQRMLLIRAASARDVLPEALSRAGAEVTIVEGYRNQIPASSISQLQELFSERSTYPDAITFTSASTAGNLVALLEMGGLSLPAGIALVSIGPITSQALCELNLHPAAEAAEPTLSAIVESLEGLFSEKE